MPKTIAVTPSWYWPAGVSRLAGVPPFRFDELLVERWARHRPHDTALRDAEQAFTGSELAHRVAHAAGALRERVGPQGRALLAAGPSAEGAVLLLALARAGVPTVLVPPEDEQQITDDLTSGASVCCADQAGAKAAVATGLPSVRLDELDGVAGAPAGDDRAAPLAAFPAGDTLAWHSHRSLLAGAVALQTFLGIDGRRPWLSTLPVSTWGGLCGIAAPLLAGAAVVLAPPGERAVDLIAGEAAGSSLWPLPDAFALTREAKRAVRGVRGTQERVVLLVDGLFDPDQRRRVGKSFDAPALTMFGLPETGPVFASHPSWYLDESIGIPITNAWVVPVDPRSGNPISTLWELVESAMVTVSSPSLLAGYEGGAHPERFRDGRFLTGRIASSDANGMIYLLPD